MSVHLVRCIQTQTPIRLEDALAELRQYGMEASRQLYTHRDLLKDISGDQIVQRLILFPEDEEVIRNLLKDVFTSETNRINALFETFHQLQSRRKEPRGVAFDHEASHSEVEEGSSENETGPLELEMGTSETEEGSSELEAGSAHDDLHDDSNCSDRDDFTSASNSEDGDEEGSFTPPGTPQRSNSARGNHKRKHEEEQFITLSVSMYSTSNEPLGKTRKVFLPLYVTNHAEVFLNEVERQCIPGLPANVGTHISRVYHNGKRVFIYQLFSPEFDGSSIVVRLTLRVAHEFPIKKLQIKNHFGKTFEVDVVPHKTVGELIGEFKRSSAHEYRLLCFVYKDTQLDERATMGEYVEDSDTPIYAYGV